MGNVYQVEMLRLLFTWGTWKTCRSPTLRRGWRAGSGNCACPPLTHSRVGWLGPRLGPREARATGAGPPGSSVCSKGIDTTLKDEEFCP